MLYLNSTLLLSPFLIRLKYQSSSDDFLLNTDDEKLRTYKNDLRKFQNLRIAVKFRYAETISYKDYEPKIKKLLDTHILANEVKRLNEPVNIFDNNLFQGVKEEQGIYGVKSEGAQADSIAYATKKVITEKMDEDPAFYQKFSKLIQQAIDEWNAKRISDIEYLQTVLNLRKKVVTKQHEDIPAVLESNDEAMAFYGVVKPILKSDGITKEELEKASSDIALAIQRILIKHNKVHFWQDDDAKNAAINDIDDYLFDVVKGDMNINLSTEQMDSIIDKTLTVAKFRNLK